MAKSKPCSLRGVWGSAVGGGLSWHMAEDNSNQNWEMWLGNITFSRHRKFPFEPVDFAKQKCFHCKMFTAFLTWCHQWHVLLVDIAPRAIDFWSVSTLISGSCAGQLPALPGHKLDTGLVRNIIKTWSHTIIYFFIHSFASCTLTHGRGKLMALLTRRQKTKCVNFRALLSGVTEYVTYHVKTFGTFHYHSLHFRSLYLFGPTQAPWS